MLISVDHALAGTVGHGDRDDLLGEHATALGGDRPAVGFGRQFVLLGAGDSVLPTQVLRRLQHAAGYRVVPATSRHPTAGKTVVHPHAATARAPAHIGGVERDIAHGFHTSGDHQVVVTGRHLQTRLNDRLQSRTTTPVHLHPADRHRQSGVQGQHPADRRRFGIRIAVAHNHIVDGSRRDSGALQESGQRGDAQVHRTQRAEHPAVATDRGADRFADDRVRPRVVRPRVAGH